MKKHQARSLGFGPRSILYILVLYFERKHTCRCFTPLNSLRSSFRSTGGVFSGTTTLARPQLELTRVQTHQEYSSRNASQDREFSSVTTTEENIDFFGAGTLGDIMSDPSEVTMKCDTATQYGVVYTETKLVQDSVSGLNITADRSDVRKLTSSGLVTSTGGTLTAQFGQKISNLSPLDRIALTANGNLQRIFSSFYDAPVHVHIEKCVKRMSGLVVNNNNDFTQDEYGVNVQDAHGEAVWDRVVHLSVFGQIFCKASSNITVHSANCVRLVESGEVGLGQLFRYLDKLPTFTILDAGRCDNGGLWRRYKLECKELTCEILEEFVPDAWQLQEEN